MRFPGNQRAAAHAERAAFHRRGQATYSEQAGKLQGMRHPSNGETSSAHAAAEGQRADFHEQRVRRIRAAQAGAVGATVGAGVAGGTATAVNHQRKVSKNMTEASTSAFNISKADGPTRGKRDAAAAATGVVLPGSHGAVAGRRGKKLRATGNELGGALAGGIAGQAIGALTRSRGAATGLTIAGNAGGAVAGSRRNERKGYYKTGVQKDAGLSPLATELAGAFGLLDD